MRVKFRLGEIDDEFYPAMRNANEYGPWEPGIQESIISMSIVLWAELSELDQELILQIICRNSIQGNRNHGMKLLRLMHRTQFLPKIGDRDPQLAISSTIRMIMGARQAVIKEMLIILDETGLWSQINTEDRNRLLKQVAVRLNKTNSVYVRDISDIIEKNGMLEVLCAKVNDSDKIMDRCEKLTN